MQTLHISRVCITQKVNAVIMRNHCNIFMWKTKIFVGFQICISVPLSTFCRLLYLSDIIQNIQHEDRHCIFCNNILWFLYILASYTAAVPLAIQWLILSDCELFAQWCKLWLPVNSVVDGKLFLYRQ